MKGSWNEKTIIWIALIALVFIGATMVYGQEEKEITDLGDHWAKGTIEKLITMNVISGYPDGTFKPNQNISGAEFIKLAVASIPAFQYPKDHTGPWYTPYVDYARANRILTDYDVPDLQAPLERADMAIIALRTLKQIQVENITVFNRKEVSNYFVDGIGMGTSFRNDGEKYWKTDEVMDSISVGLITGKPGKKIDPKGNATRAEASVVIDRLRNESARKPIDFDLTYAFIVENGWIDVPFKDHEMSEELGFDLYQEFADYHVLANKDDKGNPRPDRLEMANLAKSIAEFSDKFGTQKDIAYNIDTDGLWFNLVTPSESKYVLPTFDIDVSFYSNADNREIQVRFDQNKDWDYYKRHEAAIELIFETYFEEDAPAALARFKEEVGPHTMPYNNNYPDYDHYYLKNGRRVTWYKYPDNTLSIEFSVRP